MPLVCRNCARINPADALYCYHDGVALDGHARDSGPLAIGAQRFHSPFVFPSGKSCRSFDELVILCEANWAEAQEVLRQGYFEGFLGGLGRADLARAARHAAAAGDADRSLEDFLSKLPASTRQPPRLSVQPLEINLGQLARDRDQRFVLDLTNLGMGLLSGSVSCADTDWLSVGEGTSSTRKLFQLRNELSMPVRVVAKCLRAGSKKLEGRLNIETNGGGATVIVRAEVPVVPFPDGVLAGALKPREVASKAKLAPKEAAPLFENGAVARWYEHNGWTYPVQGPASSGLPAVQQFFEALGLVTPPKVEINKQSIALTGAAGDLLTEEIKVETAEKRHVFAHASSSAAWLKVSKVSLEGRVARILVDVPSVPAMPGERLQATVFVTANGNQRFNVDVALQVLGQPTSRPRSNGALRDLMEASAIPILALADAEPATPAEIGYASARVTPSRAVEIPAVPSVADLYGTSAPVARVVALPDEPIDPEEAVTVLSAEPKELPSRKPALPVVLAEAEDSDDRERGKTPFWMHLLPLGFLILCLMVPLGHDLWARRGSGPGGDAFAGPLDPKPRIDLHFHDKEEQVTLGSGGVKPVDGNANPGAGSRHAIWEPSMRFGLVMVNQAGVRPNGRANRLTYEEDGLTNNTVVKLDGNEMIFGDKFFRELNGQYRENWPGHWLPNQMSEILPNTAFSVGGRRSVWFYDQEKVEVNQTVEIVRGSQSNLLDTCLVRYRIHNKDQRPHAVGLRFMLDTFIGSNDGVPFLIPGATALCDTSMEFNDPARVPDFIQACEKSDLAHPGTIAQVGFRLGNKIESPTRVTLGAWPNPLLASRDFRCKQEKTRWEVPVLKIGTLNPGDSAVTIYWNPVNLGPNQFREVGFTYGLGTVSGSEGAGRLALTVGGSFEPRGEFTVTAYVSNPAPGEKVTLKMPEGFELIEPQTAAQPVPALPPNSTTRHSPVTWKVRAPVQRGAYILKVDSSTGVSQTQPVTIKKQGIFGG